MPEGSYLAANFYTTGELKLTSPESHTVNILFLYTELAGYTVACLNQLAGEDVELHVVSWPVNPEAPFQFNMDLSITQYNRSEYTDGALGQLVEKIDPGLIIVSGWIDSGYRAVARRMRPTIPVVLAMDNPWKRTPKRLLATALGRVTLHKRFSHCWVPGQSQYQYARYLGFAPDKIKTGFYSADLAHFNGIFRETFDAKQKQFPHRFLYVGRYVDFKGIFEMWEAFLGWRKETNSDWELWCVGTGDQYENRVEGEGIRHFGFLQPDELKEVIAQTGVFVLPSRKEPWGVVVQEFAASGFPLICSTEIGAVEAFLKPGLNGEQHKPQSVREIRSCFEQMANRSQEELVRMARESHELAQQISPDTWTNTVMNFFDN